MLNKTTQDSETTHSCAHLHLHEVGHIFKLSVVQFAKMKHIWLILPGAPRMHENTYYIRKETCITKLHNSASLYINLKLRMTMFI